MAHRLEDRKLKGASVTRNGCVLNAPDTSPLTPVLHYVLCLEDRRVYRLTKTVYDATMKLIDQKRKNDKHRILDEALKFNEYIVFKYDNDGNITDFEKSNSVFREVGEPDERDDLFHFLCVFNKDLTKMNVEHFGELETSREELERLNEIPTPNVVLYGFFRWWFIEDKTRVRIQLYKIDKINIDEQDFANNARWVREQFRPRYEADSDDDDVQFEVNEAAKVGAISEKKGFITGQTSVFIPEMPSKTVVFATHNRYKHWIGHEVQCDFIYSDIMDCYVVYGPQFRSMEKETTYGTHYYTRINRTPLGYEGIFYIQLDATDVVHGFYKHNQFRLVADPFGYLDMLRFAVNSQKLQGSLPRQYRVPVRDKLGGIHVTKKLRDLDCVTRFEVIGPGDERAQIDVIETLRNREITMRKLMGVVVNASEGRVFGWYAMQGSYHGFDFFLPTNHPYREADLIEFEATRMVDPDLSRPTFNITKHWHKTLGREPLPIEWLGNGQFRFMARYNEEFECYDSALFGYVPCTKAPPPERYARNKKPVERVFWIRARANEQLPNQSVFCRGEFDGVTTNYAQR